MEPTTSESLPNTTIPVSISTTSPLSSPKPNHSLILTLSILLLPLFGVGGVFAYTKYAPASSFSKIASPIFEKIGLMEAPQSPPIKENSSTSQEVGTETTSSVIDTLSTATTSKKEPSAISVETISEEERRDDLKTIEAIEVNCTEKYGDTEFCDKGYLLFIKSSIKDYSSLIVNKPPLIQYAMSVARVTNYEYESPDNGKSVIFETADGYYCNNGSVSVSATFKHENGNNSIQTEETGIKIPPLEDGKICKLNGATYPLRTCEENLILYKKCNSAVANNKEEYENIEKIRNKYLKAIWGM